MGGIGIGRGGGKRKREPKGLRVVYISSPIKVAASVSNFRALVQDLTGRDSDAVGRFMSGEFDSGESSEAEPTHTPASLSTEYEDGQGVDSGGSEQSTGSVFDIDMSWEKAGFMSQVEESLDDLLDLGCFYEPSPQIDLARLGIGAFDSFPS